MPAYDPYDDPRIGAGSTTVSFTVKGDRFAGTVLTVDTQAARDNPDKSVLVYKLREDGTGNERIMWAGSVNLAGQLVSLKPRAGDHLEITLIDERPAAVGKYKLFDVKMVSRGSDAAPPQAAPQSTPQPSAPFVGTSDEDLFG
jgi:hypothetical protein